MLMATIVTGGIPIYFFVGYLMPMQCCIIFFIKVTIECDETV